MSEAMTGFNVAAADQRGRLWRGRGCWGVLWLLQCGRG